MEVKSAKEFFKEIISQGKISNIINVIRKALENYKRANSGLWVSSLCFYTILSLVPIFAILFSLGSWLGINDYFLRKMIDYSPLNEESVELLVTFAKNFIENTRTGILAGLGFLILGWTLISMFSIIEKAFNDIWEVEKTRMFLRKITDYISFIILFPTLLVVSSGTTKIIDLLGYDNTYIGYLINIIPFLTLMIFFTALYMMIPNTKVNLIPALVSSIFISLFFQGFQSLFFLLQGMVNTYNKIYGSFSVVFIFLFWLRMMWFFLILGAHSCYFLQNRDIHLVGKGPENATFEGKENVGIVVMNELVERYLNNGNPVTAREIGKKYGFPYEVIKYVFEVFADAELIGEVVSGKEEPAYVVIKNVEGIRFKNVFTALEKYGEKVYVTYNEDVENLLNIVKNKEFDFKFKDYIEKKDHS
ncbi:YihY/virulence factor BrkB family protein [Fusobacterium sp.]|uniref:YihY/virulence factor BrkB family protein n=1 Tax=Fusobacterium sp. TaxID=68766 RepID=UPI00396C3390